MGWISNIYFYTRSGHLASLLCHLGHKISGTGSHFRFDHMSDGITGKKCMVKLHVNATADILRIFVNGTSSFGMDTSGHYKLHNILKSEDILI